MSRSEGFAPGSRVGRVVRETKETELLVELDLDGPGPVEVETGVPFFDHMLNQLGKHGCLGLTVRAKGDTEIDAHHTVEDTSIALGQALREALGDKAGIPGSATRSSRSTRPSSAPPSTCPAAPTWCTTSRPACRR